MAYRGRPMTSIALIKVQNNGTAIDMSKCTDYDEVRNDFIDWNGMNFETFLTWFKEIKTPEGRLKRINCAMDEEGEEVYFIKRRRKATLRLDPWKPLKLDCEESCFSILFRYLPFRLRCNF